MNDTEIISLIRARIVDPKTRIDTADETVGYPEIAPAATAEALERAEQTMKCPIHPFHRRLLMEVGNGGFGPGEGLVGVTGGYCDAHGRSIEELREALWVDEKTPMPHPVVPLCDWGGGVWSCVDSATGAVLTMGETSLVELGESLESWLEAWVSGVSLWERMLTFQEQTVIDPFTKKEKTIRLPGPPRGKRYVIRRSSAYR